MKATNKEHTKLVAKAISDINIQVEKTPNKKNSIVTKECQKYNLNEKSIRQIWGYDRNRFKAGAGRDD